jgi:uncharacterized membrane protein
MTISEIRARAREQLGGRIFQNAWMTALLVCLIFEALSAAAGTIVPGLGALVVVGPLTYGVCYLFLKQARDGQPMNLGDIFCGFTGDFGQNFLIGLLTAIFTFLWSLLFVIPGIIKSYAYAQAFFVKADNPDYDWRECIRTSMVMMRGHKWRLFVLDLSFLGWYIVGSLCFGVGVLWVVPYHQAARAIFYDELVAKSLADGTAVADNGWYES